MPTEDTGVTELLRRASDGLTPDVDRLVSGGITRGRSRQRRARIGTAVASLAVIGVIGTLAAVVPHLGDPDSTSGDVATEPTASVSPSPTPDPDRPPSADELRPLVTVAKMEQALSSATGASAVRHLEVDASGEDHQRTFVAIVDGAQVSFTIRWYNSPLVVQDGGEPLAPSVVCEPAPEIDCTTMPDGSRLLREESRPAGGAGVPANFLERSLTLGTYDGWQISVIARNSTDEKQGEVVASEPVLTMAEMQALATSDAWYA
ncbi:hypothetical protein [Nocardioides pinisoli]|uniref:Uncharacterized protein n=1 Tax=Nocardioides pinisoli TaxID=2950279 RepID=A0ABT1KSI7_9ACTN|nr:hypothetical protein [Nocardioides pinisoli]MCP3420708.1 hypothetical protein [Nocardioides pinisoli]